MARLAAIAPPAIAAPRMNSRVFGRIFFGRIFIDSPPGETLLLIYSPSTNATKRNKNSSESYSLNKFCHQILAEQNIPSASVDGAFLHFNCRIGISAQRAHVSEHIKNYHY
jgi:hypothetical protein